MKQYISENVWVWAGTALVLLTLSGATLNMALWVSGLTVCVHAMATFLKKGD